MQLERIVKRDHALRFSYMAVSSFLFMGANAAWNGLGYLNPLAWFLEWSSVILAFICVFLAVRTKVIKNILNSYFLLIISLVISAVSYSFSIFSPAVHNNIYQTINPIDFLVLTIPIGFLLIVFLQDFRQIKNGKFFPLLFFLSVLGSIGFLIFQFYSVTPAFSTDESVFDMYAAHLFLSGMNPYDPSLMSNAFNYYHFTFQAFSPITPLTTGGYVHTLTYPALSFLVFIPAVLLNLKASLIMLPVLLAPIVIVWYRALSRQDLLSASYSIIPFIGLLLYSYQGGSADTDALWASLLMLSYLFLPNHKTSGIFFGLSLTVKQLPILILPFFLYFVYMEFGRRKMIIWLLFAVFVFLIINSYFIIQGPQFWFVSILANEFAPLIGIGFGIPQLSFAGVIKIPHIIFTLILANLFLIFVVAYMIKYHAIKYGIFIFPVLLFLLNQRLFPQYIYYWMILSLLPMLDNMYVWRNKTTGTPTSIHVNNYLARRKLTKTVMATCVVIILCSSAFGYHEGVQINHGEFVINSVTFEHHNATGYIDSMNVDISYYGVTNHTQVFFRIFSNGPIVNGNMFQWDTVGKVILMKGQEYEINIKPQFPKYSINPSMGFMIVAYSGQIQGSYYVK